MTPIFVGLLPAAPRRLPGRRVLGADGVVQTTPTATESSTPDEVDRSSDTAVFRGSALPTKEASLNSQLAIFSGRVGHRHPVRLPRRPPGGQLARAVPLLQRCRTAAACTTGPRRSSEQALAQATFLPGGGNSVAFLEPGWFIKLRELSLTFEAPDRWARAFRASRLSLTLAGRNLLDHHRLQRGGPRGQRVRAGQLRGRGLRVPGAGALLDRAPQRRLLTGVTGHMTMLTRDARLGAGPRPRG